MSDVPVVTTAAPRLPIPELLNRYRNGESLYQLAATLGCHPSTLYKQLLRAGGPTEYYEAKVEAHQVRVFEADEKLDQATNMLEFNKAHARAKLVRQDYERACPKEYGVKQELAIDTTINVVLNKPDKPQPVVVNAPIIEVSSEVIDNTAKLEHNS